MPAARNSAAHDRVARRRRPPLEWALVSGYGDLLRTRGVARIIAAQLTARFPSGMLSLAYLLHIEGVFDSYGAAGLVLFGWFSLVAFEIRNETSAYPAVPPQAPAAA